MHDKLVAKPYHIKGHFMAGTTRVEFELRKVYGWNVENALSHVYRDIRPDCTITDVYQIPEY